MTILLVDCGNTRLKARLGSVDYTFDSVTQLSDFIVSSKINEVLLSDVAGNYPELIKSLSHTEISVSKVAVADGFRGLALAYSDVSKLGVDRWLAMTFANSVRQNNEIVVVDSGTALKIDVIDKQGRHLGGCIAPGLQLGNKALSKHADQLNEVDVSFQDGLGTDTEGCIKYGLIIGAVALIEHTVLKFTQDATVLVGGGDRNVISKHLSLPHTLINNLVLDGLSVYQQGQR